MSNGTSLTWRAAQAWLAGYSDGLEHGDQRTRTHWSDFDEDYMRGNDHGVEKREGRS